MFHAASSTNPHLARRGPPPVPRPAHEQSMPHQQHEERGGPHPGHACIVNIEVKRQAMLR